MANNTAAYTISSLTAGNHTVVADYTDASPSTGTAGTNWDLLTMSALIVPTSPASKFTITLESLGGETPTLGSRAANFGTGVYEIASITSFTNIPGLTGNSTAPVILTGTNGVGDSLFQLDTTNFGNDTSGSSDGSTYLEFIGSGTGYTGNLDLVYNATPEPGTGMLLLVGVTPEMLRRRGSAPSPSAPRRPMLAKREGSSWRTPL